MVFHKFKQKYQQVTFEDVWKSRKRHKKVDYIQKIFYLSIDIKKV